MKYFIVIFSAIILLGSCRNNEGKGGKGEEDSMEVVVDTLRGAPFDEAFPELFTKIKASDSSFNDDGFEGGIMTMEDTTAPSRISKEELGSFYPYLVFNPDSSVLAIDAVTHNYVFTRNAGQPVLKTGSPDMEVAYIDFRNNLRHRLIYLGPQSVVLDVNWKPRSVIRIAVADELKAGSFVPVLWTYNVATGEYQQYRYKHPVNVAIGNYAEDHLNSKPKTF